MTENPQPERSIHLDDLTPLGDPLVDDDLIPNGLYRLEGSWGDDDFPLADGENWDKPEIADVWFGRVAEHLAERGIRWDRDTDMVTIPAGMTNDDAVQAWHDTDAGLDEWLAEIVEETRAGRAEAYGRDVRPDTAPGGRWVTEALEIDQ